jgi:hypothetical protein
MTVRVPGSGSAEPVPVSKASQAAQIVARGTGAVLSLCGRNWVCGFLVIGILGVVLAIVGVYDLSEPCSLMQRAHPQDVRASVR